MDKKVVCYKFPTEARARQVYENLLAVLERYGTVTVADLQQLTNGPYISNDARLGWRAFDEVIIRPTDNAWELMLPAPSPVFYGIERPTVDEPKTEYAALYDGEYARHYVIVKHSEDNSWNVYTEVVSGQSAHQIAEALN